MGLFAELLRTVVRTGSAGAGMVAQRYEVPPAPGGPGGGKRRRPGKAGECTPCRAVAEIQKQRKKYGLDG